MEKLLSEQYKNENNNDNTMTGRHKKIFSLAILLQKYFLPTHSQQQKNQPYSG